MSNAKQGKNVCVVILGDIGRSPRMQYHSLSLSELGHNVDIVGYGETRPLQSLTSQPLASFHYLAPYPQIPCPKLLNYVFKTVWQAVNLLFVLLIIRRADILIVQNPPAVPSLLVCWIYTLLVKAKYIIDWHNYAHTIMALSVGSKSVLVNITQKIECLIGRRAAFNFCVTNAMKQDLDKQWGIRATTLYDKPPEIFHPITLKEKHELLSCLGIRYKALLLKDSSANTAFTELLEDNSVMHKVHRPGLIISSTSWTEDEDFSLLLAALQDYENHCKNGNLRCLPKLVCAITGKGPLKEYYCNKIIELEWHYVTVITPWLESQDYPTFLACADLGVCLHTSSSGLDLPMKVVDMFGCGVPVCAYDFNCLNELVKHGENSYKFTNSSELLEQIQNWFENFPNNEQQKDTEKKFKTNLETFQKIRWRENWNNIAQPVFD